MPATLVQYGRLLHVVEDKLPSKFKFNKFSRQKVRVYRGGGGSADSTPVGTPRSTTSNARSVRSTGSAATQPRSMLEEGIFRLPWKPPGTPAH